MKGDQVRNGREKLVRHSRPDGALRLPAPSATWSSNCRPASGREPSLARPRGRCLLRRSRPSTGNRSSPSHSLEREAAVQRRHSEGHGDSAPLVHGPVSALANGASRLPRSCWKLRVFRSPNPGHPRGRSSTPRGMACEAKGLLAHGSQTMDAFIVLYASGEPEWHLL